jgi:hypothetical protein
MRDNNGSGNHLNLKFAFSLNPLISEIALWNESEILSARPEFAVLDRATRVAEICKQLLLSDVAWVDFQSPPIWIPVGRIERDCGGSKIVACSRYELAKPISTEEGRKFKKVIVGQFRRRLKFIVKECVLAFETYNLGLTTIDGLDDVGMFRWRLTADGAHACGSKAIN